MGTNRDTASDSGSPEREAERSRKLEAIGQITGGLAHELNNHLTVVLVNADFLEALLPADAVEPQALLAELRGAAARGSIVISQLLGYSRRQMLVLEAVDLTRAVGDIAERAQRVLPDTVRLEVQVRGTGCFARADRRAVEQMVGHLITNAREAMPAGGLLRLETRRAVFDADDCAARGAGSPGDYVCLSVADTGVGMDGATRDRVFEPFFTTKPHGTGLGLAMVYGLARQQGGFAEFASEPGVGTTFRVYLPAAVGQAPEAAAGDTATPPRGRGEAILLVEDDLGLRRAAQRVLERFGYVVYVAADGEEGLEVYRDHESRIGLVVSDTVMPRLGGRELFRALRTAGKTVPFLLTSGFAQRVAASSSGAGDDPPFLPKPWTLTELVCAVRAMLDGKVISGVPALGAA